MDDHSRPSTPFGHVTLESVSARFCDGTDVATVKAKRNRTRRGRGNSNKKTKSLNTQPVSIQSEESDAFAYMEAL